MNKATLSDVITRAFVKGVSDRAILYYANGIMNCAFIASDETVDGRITFPTTENFIGDGKIGIPDLEDFIKKLNTLGDEIELSISSEGRNYQVLSLSDGLWTIKHHLIADSQLPRIRKPKSDALSMTPIQHHIDKSFIDKFYKMSGAMKDCKYLYVVSDGKSVDYYIAQSEEFTTGVRMQYQLDESGEPIESVRYNLKTLRAILNKNKSMAGTMKFHPSGLLNIDFKTEHLACSYFIISE